MTLLGSTTSHCSAPCSARLHALTEAVTRSDALDTNTLTSQVRKLQHRVQRLLSSAQPPQAKFLTLHDPVGE